MEQCEWCNQLHSTLCTRFYAWQDDEGDADVRDIADWGDHVCGMTPGTAAEVYCRKINHDGGVGDGDAFVIWVDAVGNDSYGLCKYEAVVDVGVSYASERVVE